MRQGSSSSAMKCRMDTSSSPVGWPGSISRRVSAWPRMRSGSRRSAWMIAAFWLPFSRALLCATATGSMFDVGHPGGRVGVLGDLVHVALGGDAGPDVQELADAVRGQEPDGPADERAVGPADQRRGRLDRGDRPGHVLVGQVVVGAAQPVVIDAGHIRPPGLHARGRPLRLGHRGSLAGGTAGAAVKVRDRTAPAYEQPPGARSQAGGRAARRGRAERTDDVFSYAAAIHPRVSGNRYDGKPYNP